MRKSSLVPFLLAAACSDPAPAGSVADASVDTGSGEGSDAQEPAAITCSGKAAQPLDAQWTVGGRNVRVHVPASYDPTKPTPIVLNLHGYTHDGLQQQNISKMIATSDANGFIVLHPDGHHTPRGWNAGICCGTAATSGVDDVAWLGAVLDEAESRMCIDDARVYAMGLSNGGFLSHRLGCEVADRFAAIASVAGVTGVACTPSQPVAVMQVHGNADPLIPYGGGGVNNNESVAATVARWVELNGCTAAPTTTYQQGDATCVTHSGCTANADVALCTIDGGGHQWPGGVSIGAFLGALSDDLDATNAIWAFFAAHPRS